MSYSRTQLVSDQAQGSAALIYTPPIDSTAHPLQSTPHFQLWTSSSNQLAITPFSHGLELPLATIFPALPSYSPYSDFKLLLHTDRFTLFLDSQGQILSTPTTRLQQTTTQSTKPVELVLTPVYQHHDPKDCPIQFTVLHFGFILALYSTEVVLLNLYSQSARFTGPVNAPQLSYVVGRYPIPKALDGAASQNSQNPTKPSPLFTPLGLSTGLDRSEQNNTQLTRLTHRSRCHGDTNPTPGIVNIVEGADEKGEFQTIFVLCKEGVIALNFSRLTTDRYIASLCSMAQHSQQFSPVVSDIPTPDDVVLRWDDDLSGFALRMEKMLGRFDPISPPNTTTDPFLLNLFNTTMDLIKKTEPVGIIDLLCQQPHHFGSAQPLNLSLTPLPPSASGAATFSSAASSSSTHILQPTPTKFSIAPRAQSTNPKLAMRGTGRVAPAAASQATLNVSAAASSNNKLNTMRDLRNQNRAVSSPSRGHRADHGSALNQSLYWVPNQANKQLILFKNGLIVLFFFAQSNQTDSIIPQLVPISSPFVNTAIGDDGRVQQHAALWQGPVRFDSNSLFSVDCHHSTHHISLYDPTSSNQYLCTLSSTQPLVGNSDVAMGLQRVFQYKPNSKLLHTPIFMQQALRSLSSNINNPAHGLNFDPVIHDTFKFIVADEDMKRIDIVSVPYSPYNTTQTQSPQPPQVEKIDFLRPDNTRSINWTVSSDDHNVSATEHDVTLGDVFSTPTNHTRRNTINQNRRQTILYTPNSSFSHQSTPFVSPNRVVVGGPGKGGFVNAHFASSDDETTGLDFNTSSTNIAQPVQYYGAKEIRIGSAAEQFAQTDATSIKPAPRGTHFTFKPRRSSQQAPSQQQHPEQTRVGAVGMLHGGVQGVMDSFITPLKSRHSKFYTTPSNTATTGTDSCQHHNIAELEHQIDQLHGEIGANKATISGFESTLAQKVSQIHDTEAQLAQKRNEVSALEQSVDIKQREIDLLNKRNDEQNLTIEGLRTDRDDLRDKYESMSDAVFNHADTQSKHDRLQAEHAVLQNNVVTLDGIITNLNAKLSQRESNEGTDADKAQELEELQLALDRSAGDVVALQGQLDKIQAEYSELDLKYTSLVQLNADNEAKLTEYSQLLEQNEEYAAKITAFETKLAQFQDLVDENTKIGSQLAELKIKLSESAQNARKLDELTDIGAENAALVQKITDLEEKQLLLDQIRATCELQQIDYNTLQSVNDQLQVDNQDLDQHVKDLTAQMEKLTETVGQYEARLQEGEVAKTDASYDQVLTAITDLRNQIEINEQLMEINDKLQDELEDLNGERDALIKECFEISECSAALKSSLTSIKESSLSLNSRYNVVQHQLEMAQSELEAIRGREDGGEVEKAQEFRHLTEQVALLLDQNNTLRQQNDNIAVWLDEVVNGGNETNVQYETVVGNLQKLASMYQNSIAQIKYLLEVKCELDSQCVELQAKLSDVDGLNAMVDALQKTVKEREDVIHHHEETIGQHEETIVQHEETIFQHEGTIDASLQTISDQKIELDGLRLELKRNEALENNVQELLGEIAVLKVQLQSQTNATTDASQLEIAELKAQLQTQIDATTDASQFEQQYLDAMKSIENLQLTHDSMQLTISERDGEIAMMETTLTQSEVELAAKQTQIESLSAQNDDYSTQLASITTEKDELQSKFEQLGQDSDELHGLFVENQNVCNLAKDQLLLNVEEIEELKSELELRDKSVEALQSQLASCDDSISDNTTALNDKIAALAAKVDELTLQNTQFATQVDELTLQNTQLVAQVDELTASGETSLKDLALLAGQFDQTQEDLTALTATSTVLKSDLERVNGDLAERIEEINHLQVALLAKTTEVAETQSKLELQRAEVEEVKVERDQIKAELDSKQIEIDQLKISVENSNSSQDDQVAQLNKTIGESETALADLKDQIVKKDAQLAQLAEKHSQELIASQEQLSTKDTELVATKVDLGTTRTQLDEAKAELATKQNELEKFKTDAANLTSAQADGAAAFKTENDVLKAENGDLKTGNDDLKKQLDDANRKYLEYKEKAFVAVKEAGALQEDIGTKLASLEQLDARCTELEEDKLSLSLHNDQLVAQIDLVKTEMVGLKKTNETLTQQNDIFQQEYNDLNRRDRAVFDSFTAEGLITLEQFESTMERIENQLEEAKSGGENA